MLYKIRDGKLPTWKSDSEKCPVDCRYVNRKTFVGLVVILFVLWYYKTLLVGSGHENIEDCFRDDDQNNLRCQQDDPGLVAFVRENYIFKPDTVKHHTNKGVLPGGLIQHLLDLNLINTEVPGYFIEIGANDGLRFTSTVYLDNKLQWTGLVVEPVEAPFDKLVEQGRNNIVFSNATISFKPYPSKEKFHYNPKVDLWGGLSYRFYKGTTSFQTVLCIPLHTLLLAATTPEKVDLLILDIEGIELDVLKTFPFHKMQISLIVVETYNGKDGPKAVQELLVEKGYESVGNIKVPLDRKLVQNISTIISRQDVHSEYEIFSHTLVR